MVIHFTNYFLDFYDREEKVVTIKKSLHHIDNDTNSEQFELHLEPPLYGRSMLLVNRELQESANSGNHLKIIVGKGLYNVKYIRELLLFK